MGMRGNQGRDGIPGPPGEKGETGITCSLAQEHPGFILHEWLGAL